jgi:ATP-dependent Clp protease ATP-binding subunit ClpC
VKAVRRAVSAALAGYKHLREQTSPGGVDALKTAISRALAPVIRRIEALESR